MLKSGTRCREAELPGEPGQVLGGKFCTQTVVGDKNWGSCSGVPCMISYRSEQVVEIMFEDTIIMRV